uniref:Putative leucine-rich repeat receptor-like protein kinase At5g49770 isoform X3 n=1 Tax=Rhizophora mucronata TaxID=61149 RepID=A0A2P2MNG4_RHIMU
MTALKVIHQGILENYIGSWIFQIREGLRSEDKSSCVWICTVAVWAGNLFCRAERWPTVFRRCMIKRLLRLRIGAVTSCRPCFLTNWISHKY